jgi:hypothetical protein
MMTPEEREVALKKMQQASNEFYKAAVSIGNHPFIEFAGLMNEYINACRDAHNEGIDFSECNRHRGQALPLHPVRSDYLNEKLECIFSGAKVLDGSQCEPVGAVD